MKFARWIHCAPALVGATLLGLAPAALVTLAAAPAAAELPESEEDKLLYFLGINVARSLNPFQLKEDERKIVIQGIEEALAGSAPQLDEAKYGRAMQELLAARRADAVEAEKKASAAFLAEEAKKSGAETTPSGLIFTEIETGSGKQPEAGSRVRVHYEGKLRDGRVFDSSIQRGQPAEFPLSGVIQCWQEGVQKLKVGGRARLVCPPDIAYGDRGAPPRIPGGAALAFDVELLAILE